jgi:predicted MFS family arabinose efflux permease
MHISEPAERSLARANDERVLPLRENVDFSRLWAAQSVSLFGSAITALALPLMAVIELNASSLQMGLLTAAGTLPFLFFSLFAGVWVDHRKRRPLLIATDLIRFVLLLSVPIAAWFDWLRLSQLYIVAFVIGSLGVLFEIAHYAYVPSLVGRNQVVNANSKLQVSYSVADSAGPGVAGMIVQVVSAPFALLFDAASFLVSALFLRQIQRPEPAIANSEPVNIRSDIASGLRFVLGHRFLRPIIGCAIVDGFFVNGIIAIFVLYATRDLDLAPLALGVIFAARGLGAIPGALLSEPVAVHFGVGSAIVGGWAIATLTWLVVPVVRDSMATPILTATAFIGGTAGTILNVQQWSLRQIVTPDALQGRVTASHRFLVYGAEPLGALSGGVAGSVIGLRPTIAIFACAALIAPILIAFSPVRTLVNQPESAN